MSKVGSRKVRESESPKVSPKSEAGSPESEEENDSLPAGQADAFDVPKSEINIAPSKSPPVGETFENATARNNSEITNKSDIKHPKSEIKEPLTTHNSPLTTMEVHHHPEVEKKGIKEYVLEGLMIFLAVTMGFFAESLREHIADKNREAAYMRSMVQDLKSDTAALTAFVNFEKGDVKMTDSLIAGLYAPDNKKRGNDIYYFARKASIPYQIIFNDRTRQQLKSSGSLRLIDNVPVSGGIMAYDQKLRITEFEMTQIEVLRESYRELAGKVFDMKIFNDMLQAGKVARPVNNPQLFATDPALINSMVGALQYLKNAYLIQGARAGQLLNQAEELIELINKEYHLQNE